MNNPETSKLLKLFNNNFNETPEQIILLPVSGSQRKYYRIITKTNTYIGTYNEDKKENIAFLSITDYFLKHKLPVPEVYASELENSVYLQQDLGDITLFNHLADIRAQTDFENKLVRLYKSVIDELIKFQLSGREGFDYSKCYPRKAFDKQSMHWVSELFQILFHQTC